MSCSRRSRSPLTITTSAGIDDHVDAPLLGERRDPPDRHPRELGEVDRPAVQGEVGRVRRTRA